MMKRLVRMLALLLLLQACASPERPSAESSAPPSTPAPTPAPPLEDFYASLEEQGFVGLVMVKRGAEVESMGFGLADRVANAEWDQDTVFTVGSITKQFTGAAIVKLEMEGKLSVDDKLGVHVPYATGELADVTLHELLTHTAGLPGGLGDDFAPVGRTEIVELSAAAVETRGEYNYSNPGYSMLGVVIEEVTGMSYEEYLRSALFLPAGMTKTGYLLPDWSDSTVAIGYDGPDTWGRPNEQRWDTDGPYWHLRANGGVLSTGVDMVKWHDALLGDDLLDEAAKAKLFGRHVPEGAEGGPWYYGYGWVNVELGDGSTLITHNGGNGVFFADFLRFVDDDLTILVATNVAGTDEDVAFRLGDALLGTELAAPVTANCVPDGDISSLDLLEGFPEGDAGDAVEGMLLAITSGDDAQRQAFAEAHVSSHLSQGMNPAQVSAELALMQEEFAPFAFREVRQSEEFTYHLVLTSAPETEGDAVISLALNPELPSEIGCLDLGFGY